MNELELVELIKREILKHTQDIRLENEKTIKFIGNDEVLKHDLENVFKLSDDAEKVVVSNLTIQDLVSLSQGSYSSGEGKEILDAILAGREVILSRDGINWRSFNKIPSALQKVYEGHEQTLKDFGVFIVDRMEVRHYIEKKENYYMEKIMDVKTIKNRYFGKKEILVSKDTIVTELAMEYARAENIRIIKG